jgi:hypothetical protein
MVKPWYSRRYRLPQIRDVILGLGRRCCRERVVVEERKSQPVWPQPYSEALYIRTSAAQRTSARGAVKNHPILSEIVQDPGHWGRPELFR